VDNLIIAFFFGMGHSKKIQLLIKLQLLQPFPAY